ncbi:MerR family transcriptional regulator [Blautia pseudococcoides]|uniref:MerR family transcriptional regulator n=1 Tax=Blautia pseudococcoides TaxID=1796616 RepID=UPI00148AFBC1|nr:MerR family transcriptional regulator [Blautia pseudococcoides]QJU13620.1 MerR family transcriptional regulator [Blautia pseudococcoides]
MTLNEASRRFHISMDKLNFYEENGLLEHRTLTGGVPDYTESDLRRIGLIHALLKSGLNMDTLKTYLNLIGNKTSSKEEQIKILRKQRFKLLDDIHEKQQSLDELDFMIDEIKKGAIK